MRYFNEIPLWKIVLLNIIVGLCVSGPFLIGIVLCFGLFTPPSANEQLSGILIFIAILFVIFLSNYLLWKFSRRRPNGNIKSPVKRTTLIKLILILIILVLAVGSFFTLPGIWIRLNGWWF